MVPEPTPGVAARLDQLLQHGPVHMTLLDPASSPGKQGETIAVTAARAGTHAIMVGGSTDVTQENVDLLVDHIKDATHLPVIYFPSSAGAMPQRADALWFLSTLNSRDAAFISGEQARGAPFVHALGVEPLPLGYIIVEPGMRVGKVSRADVVARDDEGIHRAVGLALAAQYFGMRYVYLEAGSGAPEPVPVDMVAAVKAALASPPRGVAPGRLVVGGGIREPEQADALLAAGADILVTGTIAENEHFDRLRAIIGRVLAPRTDAPAAKS